ncbi:hypothetical protein GGI12_002733 [Dipsacomyces acuminosporus]|nr:hypothetical protein GGI12_002733 [Dipsacomyces acuminosporus]
MSRRIREYPRQAPHKRAVTSNLRTIREKFVVDINTFVERREYGKASELLLIALEHVSVPLSEIWRPFIATLRQQENRGSIGSYYDIISIYTKKETPNPASLERVFYDIERGNMEAANAAMATYSTDQGSKLALAHGYRGILIACLREMEIREGRIQTDLVEPSDAHIFAGSESVQFIESVQFMLSKTSRWITTKFSLQDAESHLSRALMLDDDNDYFKAFHIQVLVAMERLDEAKERLRQWYEKDKSVHVLRMLMSVYPKGHEEQQGWLLEYLELDPFASEYKHFRPYMDRVLEQLGTDAAFAERVFRMVVNRVELGDPAESYKWKCMALMITALRRAHPNVADEAVRQRLHWWKEAYFSPHNFYPLQESDLQVYMAVCAQQLFDLEQGHPVYSLLSGELNESHESFVNDNIRLPSDAESTEEPVSDTRHHFAMVEPGPPL